MKKAMIDKKLQSFDIADFLQNRKFLAEYLRQVLEEGDASELAAALGHVARFRGMAEIANETGITREALYKALRGDSQPRLDTLQRVCKALGVKLTIEPVI